MTFTPCFVFVFLGAPWVERLQANKSLAGALAGVTAAVVGVIGNLAVWFGLRVLFRQVTAAQYGLVTVQMPLLNSLDLPALLLAAVAAICLFSFKLGVVKTLGIAAAGGVILQLALGIS